MSRFLVLAHDGEEEDDILNDIMEIIEDDDHAVNNQNEDADDDDDEGVLVADSTCLHGDEETDIINTLQIIVALLQKIVQCLEQR